MVFAGIPFLFYFLPLLLGAYYAVPRRAREARNGVLLVGSLLFYAWGEGPFLLVLLASIVVNHAIAHHVRRGRGWLVAGIAANLAGLGLFKYSGFLAQSAGIEGFNGPHLPLGISFFTFQAISYLIDVARRDAEPARSLLDSGLYIASFPQLIAGPIVRFKTIAHDLRHREETGTLFEAGVKLFILGLGQKVLWANLAAGPADVVFGLPADEVTTLLAWAGLFAYSLQIFFDFAGYSNMAMGLGLMVGFRFPRNFDYPYTARSVAEFWRRWHITLSAFFRDYLYIPLGGSRRGFWRTAGNLWAVFLLCGLWHGAAWTFILWGAWHGLFLTVERTRFGALLRRAGPLGHLYAILAVGLGWVLFRAESIGAAGAYYAALFGAGASAGPSLGFAFPGEVLLWLLVAAAFTTPWPERAGRLILKAPRAAAGSLSLAGFALLFVASAAFLFGGSYNPFIYFRF